MNRRSGLLVITVIAVGSLAAAQGTRPSASADPDAAVRLAIRSELEQAAPGGVLRQLDPRTGETVELRFVELHDSVHRTADGSAFACADFKDGTGKLYDLDVYVRPAGGRWDLTEMLIHKVAGADRVREPKGASAPSAETATRVREAIEAWTERQAALHNGLFPFYDPRASSLKTGKVEEVHKGVHPTGDGMYYACVDVRADRKLHDLDVYVRPVGDGFEVAEVVVHKVEGKDRIR